MSGFLATAGPAPGEPPSELVVGTSGDYAPFSVRQASAGGGVVLSGFGPALARAYADDRGLALRFVPFRWPELVADLEAGRFDVAMSGVTVRPERSLAGRFTVPTTTSGAMVLVARDHRARGVADLDRPETTIAVNAGGHLERVTRAHFPRARITAVADNAGVLPRLVDGRVSAVVTDSREAPHWLAAAPGMRALGPFTRDRKALLVRADREDLARDLDAWLLAAERDGRLGALRAEYLDEPDGPGGGPLRALLAAIDERLALMPAVAEAKRRSGAPVEVPEREQRVLDAGVASVRRARATDAALEAGEEKAVRAVYRAQIEAAKAIQRATLAKPRALDAAKPPDLDTSIRPALIRIGDRIAALLVALPGDVDREAVHAAARDELVSGDPGPEHVAAIADAIAGVAAAMAPRAPLPAQAGVAVAP